MWDEVLGVNLNGVFFVTRQVLPAMVEAGWGRIINMTSIVGQTGNFGQANYAVTKGGLIAFTMTLAREVARKGVTVNAVAPGFIETDMTKDMTAGGAGRGHLDDPGRTARKAGRSRRSGAVPRLAPGQLYHRPGHSGQRRDVHVHSGRIRKSFRNLLPIPPIVLSSLRRSTKMISHAKDKSDDLFQQAMRRSKPLCRPERSSKRNR